MTLPRNALLRNLFASLAILVLTSGAALAQGLAGKTVRIIVPFPPGGTADILARLLAQHAQNNGQQILIENRPGAGTAIATEAVSRAAPDGTTVLVMANSFVINGILRKNLAYDPLTSFEPVCHLVDSPQVIVVNSSSPYQSLADLIKAAQAQPGTLTIGSVGPATTQHIAAEMFKRSAKINLTFVPYPGGAPAVNALLGNHITVVLANYSEVMEQVRSGKFRALAVPSPKRIEPLPNVPTLTELGFKDADAEVWFGLVVPAKTPAPVLTQLSSIFTAALQTPDIKSKLVAQGLYPTASCGAAFGAHIRKQHEIYSRVIGEAGIKVD